MHLTRLPSLEAGLRIAGQCGTFSLLRYLNGPSTGKFRPAPEFLTFKQPLLRIFVLIPIELPPSGNLPDGVAPAIVVGLFNDSILSSGLVNAVSGPRKRSSAPACIGLMENRHA